MKHLILSSQEAEFIKGKTAGEDVSFVRPWSMKANADAVEGDKVELALQDGTLLARGEVLRTTQVGHLDSVQAFGCFADAKPILKVTGNAVMGLDGNTYEEQEARTLVGVTRLKISELIEGVDQTSALSGL